MDRPLLIPPPMNTPPRYAKSTRIQTTISVLEEAVQSIDHLAQESGVSRSRLMDLAVRRFLRWAANMDPQDLQLIAEYEVTEPISGFVRRPTPAPMAAVEPQRAKVLSSSAPPPELQTSSEAEEQGPITPPRGRRVPVEEAPAPARVRDRSGRYSETPRRDR